MPTIMKLGIGRKFYPVLFKWTKYSVDTETVWKENQLGQTPPLAPTSGIMYFSSADKSNPTSTTVGEFVKNETYYHVYLDMVSYGMLAVAGYTMEGSYYVFRGMLFTQVTQNCAGSTNYGTVTSTSPTAYPSNGEQGGYWYKKIS